MNPTATNTQTPKEDTMKKQTSTVTENKNTSTESKYTDCKPSGNYFGVSANKEEFLW